MSEKVSRRAILDRSLNYDPKLDDTLPDQDDIWYSSSKLFEDHVSEIHGKWDAIEDDIWGKVIVMERNRRVAKAYVRSPVVSVGGGNEGFDGLRVGLKGFDNPFRDEETRAVLSRCDVYIFEEAIIILNVDVCLQLCYFQARRSVLPHSDGLRGLR